MQNLNLAESCQSEIRKKTDRDKRISIHIVKAVIYLIPRRVILFDMFLVILFV